jgi:hypothetical protein
MLQKAQTVKKTLGVRGCVKQHTDRRRAAGDITVASEENIFTTDVRLYSNNISWVTLIQRYRCSNFEQMVPR